MLKRRADDFDPPSSPHMAVIFHDANSMSNDDAVRINFVEYGRPLERPIKKLKSSCRKQTFESSSCPGVRRRM